MEVSEHWEPCNDHDWEKDPIDFGKFRCANCDVVGYVKQMIFGVRNKFANVTYYKCTKCKGPTTRARNLCPNCTHGQTTSVARQDHGASTCRTRQ